MGPNLGLFSLLVVWVGWVCGGRLEIECKGSVIYIFEMLMLREDLMGERVS